MAPPVVIECPHERTSWNWPARIPGNRGGTRGKLLGGRDAGCRRAERESQFAALGLEDHRSPRSRCQGRAHDLPADPHRYQSGGLWFGRSARWREPDLRPDTQEPAAWRKSVQYRQDFSQDQAIRISRPPGGWRLRYRNGALGPGRQSVWSARLSDARWKVSRQDSLLRGYDRVR